MLAPKATTDHGAQRMIENLKKCMIAAVALGASTASASTPAERLKTLLDDAAETAAVQGSFLVINDGAIAFEYCLGTDRSEPDEQITPETRFEIASITKPITAIAIATLAEREILDIDAPASRYLNNFPHQSITVRQLLNHTSGLPNQASFIAKHWNKSRPATNANLLATLAQAGVELVAAPGEKVVYSNINYWILALIIEETSGEPFETYLQNHVFIPLEMSDTSVRAAPLEPATAPPRVAVSEVIDSEGDWVRAGDTPSSAFVDFLAPTLGAVHITSTPRDLVKLMPALRGEAIINRATAREMTKPARLNNDEMAVSGTWKPHAVGLGWKLSRPAEVWHDGNWGGFVSYASFQPEDNDAFIYLLNRTPTDYSPLPSILAAVGEIQNPQSPADR